MANKITTNGSSEWNARSKKPSAAAGEDFLDGRDPKGGGFPAAWLSLPLTLKKRNAARFSFFAAAG
jgi:hypothetical protein